MKKLALFLLLLMGAVAMHARAYVGPYDPYYYGYYGPAYGPYYGGPYYYDRGAAKAAVITTAFALPLFVGLARSRR